MIEIILSDGYNLDVINHQIDAPIISTSFGGPILSSGSRMFARAEISNSFLSGYHVEMIGTFQAQIGGYGGVLNTVILRSPDDEVVYEISGLNVNPTSYIFATAGSHPQLNQNVLDFLISEGFPAPPAPAEPDTQVGTNNSDYIQGGEGNSDLDGRTGDDTIFGNSGADTIFGNVGSDTVFAGAGDDEIWGYAPTENIDRLITAQFSTTDGGDASVFLPNDIPITYDFFTAVHPSAPGDVSLFSFQDGNGGGEFIEIYVGPENLLLTYGSPNAPYGVEYYSLNVLREDIRDNQLHRMTLSRDNVDGTIKFYLDGELNTVITGDLTIPQMAGNFLGTGKVRLGTDSRYADFQGQVGDIAIFASVLTEDEIIERGMDVFTETSDPRLAAFWDFEQSSGNIVPNFTSGYGRTMYLSGFPGRYQWWFLDGDDELNGGEGNDTLIGGGGNDELDGGQGTDTATYTGNQSSYTLTLSPTSTVLEDRRSGGDGTDNLIELEALDFDVDLLGVPFDLTQFAGPAGLSAEQLESFIELYIAYFNRAPDAVGLFFWGTAFANGTSLGQMASLFIDQDETRSTYPNTQSNSDFATSVYSNVLGRIPDILGFNFWVDLLNSGSVTRDAFILEVLKGAKAAPPLEATQEFIDQQLADQVYLASKTDIGAYFAVHKGMSDVANAQTAMALFDGTQDGVDVAVAAIDGFFVDSQDALTGEFLMPLVGVLDDPFLV